jgi:calcineurin-like phosphoesterase
MPARLPVAEKSKVVQFNAVLIVSDEATGRAKSITRVDKEFERDV